jgi:hypothetical protein
MNEIKCGSKSFKFRVVTGHVLSNEKRSETKVWSSGGGGYVGGYGGFVEAPQVHSQAVTCQEFWLASESGNEEYVQIQGVDIPLREGQKISIIYLSEKGKSASYHALLINHNANKYWFTKGLPADYLFYLSQDKLLYFDRNSNLRVFRKRWVWHSYIYCNSFARLQTYKKWTPCKKNARSFGVIS